MQIEKFLHSLFWLEMRFIVFLIGRIPLLFRVLPMGDVRNSVFMPQRMEFFTSLCSDQNSK